LKDIDRENAINVLFICCSSKKISKKY